MNDNALDFFAGRFHGALIGAHAFIAYYNFKRNNRKQALLHLAFVGVEVWAMRQHAKELG